MRDDANPAAVIVLGVVLGLAITVGLIACARQDINRVENTPVLPSSLPSSHVKQLQITPSFEEVQFDDGTKCVIFMPEIRNSVGLSCQFPPVDPNK